MAHLGEGEAMGEQQLPRPDEASEAAIYVVSYIEVMAPSTPEAAATLRLYREASHEDEDHAHLEVLQQNGRPDHFAIIEVWRNPQAFEAHGMAPHTKRFRETLQPLLGTPYDERLHSALAIGSTQAARDEETMYVVTHADAIPPAKDGAISVLK